MFDLEQSIAAWRKQMLAAGIKTPVPLEELESHLRDEVERQAESGLSEREAFSVAVQKIGAPQGIQSEFRKVEAVREDRQWQFGQFILVALTGLFPILCVSAAFSKHGVASEMTHGQIISLLAAVTSLPLLTWGGRLSYRLFPVIQCKRNRAAIHLTYLLPVIFWWIGLLRLILPRYDFTVGQLMVIISWALFTTMGLCFGLLWGIEAAARKKVAPARL